MQKSLQVLLQCLFMYIKTQVENLYGSDSFFTLDQIMHLHIIFHELALTQGSCYIELPEWITKKKAVIYPKNPNEECFKWKFMTALHHEETEDHLEKIYILQHYEDQCNWMLEFQLTGIRYEVNPDLDLQKK